MRNASNLAGVEWHYRLFLHALTALAPLERWLQTAYSVIRGGCMFFRIFTFPFYNPKCKSRLCV